MTVVGKKKRKNLSVKEVVEYGLVEIKGSCKWEDQHKPSQNS